MGWLMVHGSWLMIHGDLWFMVNGDLWFMVQGSGRIRILLRNYKNNGHNPVYSIN